MACCNSASQSLVAIVQQRLKDAVADDAGKKTNEEPANEGERNGQEKEGGASNKEDDQNVQDFRAELDNLHVKTKEGNKARWFAKLLPEKKALIRMKVFALLLGLKQSEPVRDLVTTYVLEIDFERKSDKTLIYQEDKEVSNEFYGELTFFLGLQVMQRDDGIFISTTRYVVNIKEVGFCSNKDNSTPLDNKALLKDEEAEDVNVHLYRSMIRSLMYLKASRPDIMFVCLCLVQDSDYAGVAVEGKSTTGGCQFLSKRLISWQCKKKTIVANSTTEIEYVTAANCCGQAKHIEYMVLNASLLKGRDTKIPQSGGPPEKVGDEAVHKELGNRMERAATTTSSLEAEQDSGFLSFFFYTTLSRKWESVELTLKQTKLTYGAAYTKLIMKVKKLENRIKSSKARKMARLIVSEDEDDLEDPSKQERKIAQLDADEGVTLVQIGTQTQWRHEHDLEPNFEFTTPEEVYTVKPDISTANVPVSTAGAEVLVNAALKVKICLC
ncbi:hypothetical protein Tco_1317211 [Tanacetum coccineum]